jgi:hypothetical protein
VLPALLGVAWLTLPATTGTALGRALDDRSGRVSVVVAGLAWLVWAGVLLAMLVPRPVGLVALRVAAVAAVGATVWAVVDSGSAAGAGWVVLASVPALLAYLPATGERFVNGAAYGDERRFLLRPPAAVLLGPILLTGAVVIAGVVGGPVLLAAGWWVVGGLALVVGLPAAWVATRALVRLTERWVVLVPAGLVVKDHTALVEPMLFRREDIARFGPAPAGSTSTDLTAGSWGLALELQLLVPYQVSQVTADSGQPHARELQAVLVTPTRPGALVAEAGRRRIPG